MVKASIREIGLGEYLIQRQNLSNPLLSLFDFYYLTGARTSEPLMSKRGDISFEKQNAFIHTEKNPNSSYRTVGLYDYGGLASELISSVQLYAESRPFDELLWPFPTHEKPRNYVWQTCKKTFNCTTHSLRHTHAIMLVRDLGYHMNELMAEMGWANISSTMAYIQYENEASRRQKMGLSPLTKSSSLPSPSSLSEPVNAFQKLLDHPL